MTTLDDELTGVHNRRSFIALLRRHIGFANDRQTALALVVADLDGFARINAAHGYDFGDQVLCHLARQLREVARAQDYVARIGDNRFALILPRIMNQGHAELAVQKLLRRLELPFEAGGHRLRLGVTIGAALCPQHASHPDHLLRQAEKCVALARTGGERYRFAPEHSRDEGLPEAWDLEIELDGAIERGEMSMHYQPKVRLSDLHPVGSEALMRWQHRSRGALPPGLFIPIAERTGRIKAMTMWAMNTALRQASPWTRLCGPQSVAVNVPAELVAQHDLPDLVENALRLWGTPDLQLVLEITERSLVTDPAHSFRVLSQIRELGVKISIDDFGTGYSCLAYFKNIPADELKIDKSFVSGLLDDPASADITALIIDLAHRFGLSVVAEGVEDAPTLAALRQRGCDVVQGHLLGEAMPARALEGWLQRAVKVPQGV